LLYSNKLTKTKVRDMQSEKVQKLVTSNQTVSKILICSEIILDTNRERKDL